MYPEILWIGIIIIKGWCIYVLWTCVSSYLNFSKTFSDKNHIYTEAVFHIHTLSDRSNGICSCNFDCNVDWHNARL